MVVEDIKVDKVADDVSDMMMDMEDKPGQVMEIFCGGRVSSFTPQVSTFDLIFQVARFNGRWFALNSSLLVLYRWLTNGQ